MFKKGQAAMEFLMTYGWAILVVLAAIGALAYFGVLSPDTLLPERTTFQAPLTNVDTAYIDSSTGAIEIAFSNNVGYDINVTGTGNVTALEVANTDVLSVDCGSPTLTVPSGLVNNNDRFTVKWDCGSPSWTAGERVKATLNFEYINSYTNQTRKQTGTVNGKVS